ncbi:MAG: ferrous iron transport protein [Burkholderiales bacterium]|jgi:ferrous iron transport protein A|nr:ferrous iron transport protein [Burkholderiales bacterium]
MGAIALDKLNKGDRGIITKIDETVLPQSPGLAKGEIESRLLEMGFIEGARLTVMHLGMINHDPIAVRINNSSSIIALRKNEAGAIMLEVA